MISENTIAVMPADASNPRPIRSRQFYSWRRRALVLAGESAAPRVRLLFGALLIVALVFMVYRPILPGSFVIDDLRLIKEKNPLTTGEMSPWTIWFQTDFTLSTFVLWLQWLAWGENPGGYHAVNMALHALSAILVWRLLARLKVPGAWLVAVVFTVHPVCVNSVARVAEVKNTLSLPFFLLSFWLYLRSGPAWFGLSLVAFVLALLSKTSTVMLPLLLLSAAMWERGRLTRHDCLRASPYFALSLAFGLMSVWFQKYQALASAGRLLAPTHFLERLATAGRSFWFYLSKALWPFHLNLFYVSWNPESSRLAGFIPGLLLCATFLLCWRARHGWGRPLLFGLGCFLVTLFPALGFFDSQFLTLWQVSDHLQYLPLIAPLALAIGGGMYLLNDSKDNFSTAFASSSSSSSSSSSTRPIAPHLLTLRRITSAILPLGLVLALSVLTFNRARIFSTEETLFRDTLAKNPAASVVHNDLGVRLAKNGNNAEALAHFRAAVQSNPIEAGAQLNLALALALGGDCAEAEPHFLAATKLQPENPLARKAYANALARQGRVRDAITQLTAALCFKPDLQTRLDLAGLHVRAGSSRLAAAQFRKVLAQNPNLPEPLSNLAWLLATSADDAVRDGTQAVQHAERACNLTGFHETIMLSTLAAAYAEAGRFPEAVTTAETAVRLQTANGETRLAALNQQLLPLYRAGHPYHARATP